MVRNISHLVGILMEPTNACTCGDECGCVM
jgi:hypothetical protein